MRSAPEYHFAGPVKTSGNHFIRSESSVNPCKSNSAWNVSKNEDGEVLCSYFVKLASEGVGTGLFSSSKLVRTIDSIILSSASALRVTPLAAAFCLIAFWASDNLSIASAALELINYCTLGGRELIVLPTL